MSDDTPTQRFPEAGGGDTPTQRLDTGGIQEDLQEEKQKSRGLLIGLIIAGALLLVAIIVVVVILVGRGQGDPIVAGTDTPAPTDSSTPTPSATPTPTPTPTPSDDAPPPPPPPSTNPAINQWQVTPATVQCNTQAPNPSNQYLAFKWSTSNADQIDIGIVDENGYQLMYYNVAPNGTQQSIGQDIIYLCPRAQMVWRMTIYKNGNEVTHKDVTIKNNGDQQ